MRRMLVTYLAIGVGVGAFLGGMYFTAWRTKVVTVQRGYRGTGMELNVNKATAKAQLANNEVPEPYPMAPDVGPKAGEIYQNVQVLKDLSIAQFGRLMNAISVWVVGNEEGCNYCHNLNNMASDELYTKHVARRMIQMNQHINMEWQAHVGETGVTCYTCHRGNVQPEYLWYKGSPGPAELAAGLGTRAGQNIAGESVGLSSLPTDPFTPFLLEDYSIRVIGPTPLPTGNRRSIKQTEWTYGLMMHMSNALGVNCTYCHNSRAMAVWEQSPPTRSTAWYGIRMARTINKNYIESLSIHEDFVAARKGPEGDLPKANCMTCHQGAYKPLYGAKMLKDYPSLGRSTDYDEVSVIETSGGEDPPTGNP